MLIVVMKQGNACGAKGHASLCRSLRQHFAASELIINGNVIRLHNKESSRVLFVNSGEEPDEGNPHVRFCEGGSISHGGAIPLLDQSVAQIPELCLN
jgi:hypothetical protein